LFEAVYGMRASDANKVKQFGQMGAWANGVDPAGVGSGTIVTVCP